MSKLCRTSIAAMCFIAVHANAENSYGELKSTLSPFVDTQESSAVVLKNDGFGEEGGQSYLQLGFIKGEKAGVFLKVPTDIPLFKIDSFRVLISHSNLSESPNTCDDPSLANARGVTAFFHMGILTQLPTSAAIPADIENAADVTPGSYWNDIPAQGDGRSLGCAAGGNYVGAALEFTHDGSPSVFRDMDGLQAPKLNSIFAIPGGWTYSSALGLRGDWILRVVGHRATAAECQ